jgi:hypothetical protein
VKRSHGRPMGNPIAKFSTTLLQAGKTATGMIVPEEAVAKLGNGKRPPVKVSIKRIEVGP